MPSVQSPLRRGPGQVGRAGRAEKNKACFNCRAKSHFSPLFHVLAESGGAGRDGTSGARQKIDAGRRRRPKSAAKADWHICCIPERDPWNRRRWIMTRPFIAGLAAIPVALPPANAQQRYEDSQPDDHQTAIVKRTSAG